MAKTKYMVTSGFLGAGKTTSMLAFARSINARWGKAAILANDLGASNIVDADFTATSDVLTPASRATASATSTRTSWTSSASSWPAGPP